MVMRLCGCHPPVPLLLGFGRQNVGDLLYCIRILVHTISAIGYVGWQVKFMIIQKVKCKGVNFFQLRLVTNIPFMGAIGTFTS